jgi:hypothetical protein
MASRDKILEQVLRGRSDANIGFTDLRNLLLRLGFAERTSGGHHLFRRSGIRELINLQKDGNQAKPYQVRQVRRIIIEYRLALEE